MSLQAPSLSMRDLQAVADAAVVAAEAFVAESKLAPTFADVASDMATSDAATGFMQVAEAAGSGPRRERAARRAALVAALWRRRPLCAGACPTRSGRWRNGNSQTRPCIEASPLRSSSWLHDRPACCRSARALQ